MDWFLLLTPLLILGIVALFAFVGCYTPVTLASVTMSVTPLSSPSTGGTVLTITGEDFSSTAVANFDKPPNEIDVPCTLVAPGTLNVTTPAHPAGSVDLTVSYDTTSGGNTVHLTGVLPSGTLFTFYDVVVPLQPPALSRKTGTNSNSVSLPAHPGTKLVIVTVQWGAGLGAALSGVAAPGITFTQLGITDTLSPQDVASFYAFADLSSGLTVTATLTAGSNTDFNLLVSAYDFADPTSAPLSASSKQGTGVNPGPSLALQTSTLAPGDLVYAIAIARSAGAVLSGSWTAGSGFTAQAGQNGYLLLQTYLLQQSDIDAGQVNVTATDAAGSATSRWYLFAAAIKHV